MAHTTIFHECKGSNVRQLFFAPSSAAFLLACRGSDAESLKQRSVKRLRALAVKTWQLEHRLSSLCAQRSWIPLRAKRQADKMSAWRTGLRPVFLRQITR